MADTSTGRSCSGRVNQIFFTREEMPEFVGMPSFLQPEATMNDEGKNHFKVVEDKIVYHLVED
jgi:hypothetical protein